MLSGVPNCPWVTINPFVAKERAISLAANLGANASNYEEVKTCLIETEWKDIVEATTLVHSDNSVDLVFWPTIESKLIPDDPLHMLKKCRHLNGKEMITSFTKDES